MTDLTASQWKEIEANAVTIFLQGQSKQYISVGKLRTLLRRSKRSLDQNALLWALYTEARDKGGELLAGWDSATIHEFMLGEYFGWVTSKALGQVRKTPVKRSSTLTKMEFSDFLEFVVRRFAEHGIVLDLPDERAA